MSSDQLTQDILSAKAGDRDAWERLFVRYRPAVESWSRKVTASHESSQRDLLQDAWLQIWKGLQSFEGGASDQETSAMFYSWLRVTARNAILSRLKIANAKRRQPDLPMANGQQVKFYPNQDSTPSSIVARNESLDKLEELVAELPDSMDRQIFTIVMQDGLSIKEAARLLERDYSTVRRRLHRLLERLGNLMD